MKQLCYFCSIFLLFACSKEYNFELPLEEQKIVCNSLFSPDSHWRVKVETTFPFMKQDQENWIENAQVFIIANEIDTIHLRHLRKGEYISNEIPDFGVNYRLHVVVDDDTIISTRSHLPEKITIELIEVNENMGAVQFEYYSVDELYELKCKAIINDKEIHRLMIRTMTFDTLRSYRTYAFNDAVFQHIFERFNDRDLVDRLSYLKGDTIYGYNVVYVKLETVLGTKYNYETISNILDDAYIGESENRNSEAFQKQMSFSNSSLFHTNQKVEYSLLGVIDRTEIFNIYMWNFLEGEYWLQLKILNEEAYLYYESYLAQISNRIDFASIMSPVYSNMSNGVGIFAGYSQEMIQVK